MDSFNPEQLYTTTLNARLELPDLHMTLYPGKQYQIRGDVLNANPEKVASAQPI